MINLPVGNWGTGPCDWDSGKNGFSPSEHKNNKYYKKIIRFRDGLTHRLGKKSGRLNPWRTA